MLLRLVILACSLLAVQTGNRAVAGESRSMLSVLEEPLSGDLDAILDRGSLRVLVEYGPTGFFVDGGTLRGFEFELVHRFVEHLRRTTNDARTLNVVFVPLPFEKILPALAEGRGDIAAATITVTAERAAAVIFSRPYLSKVREAVIAGKRATVPRELSNLQGATIHVESGTSYVASAERARQAMIAEGLVPFDLVVDHLSTDKLLEMASAGIVDYVVADGFAARLWSKVLPGMTVSPVAFDEGNDIAWALRQGTPKLKAAIDQYLQRNRKGSLVGNVLFERYFQNTKWVAHPLDDDQDADRLRNLQPLFHAAADEQGIEWLLLAAQGYQESRLDQGIVSAAGAVGVMQILPSTAEDPVIGGADIFTARGNIVGGARYLQYLRGLYGDVPDPIDAWSLAFAAYNAGPRRIEEARRRASAAGHDPARWQGSVEFALLELVGPEPIRYVGNIHKYYVAYRLGLTGGSGGSP